MEVLYGCWCGIDVQAKMLVACLLKAGCKEVRTFSTMTEDLLHLLDWLITGGVHARGDREYGRVLAARL